MKRRGTAIGRSLFLKHPSQAGVCYCGFLFSNTALDSIVSLVPRSDPLGPLQKRNYGANKLLYDDAERPPDPKSLLSPDELQERAEMLIRWWESKTSVLCWTGAGLSTESGIPDYRGHDGSYRRGHQPMVHEQFMQSPKQRQRYWGRGMVGWKDFAQSQPNAGHFALAELERMGRLGVKVEDRMEFYNSQQEADWLTSSGQPRQLAVVTQNVDTLHRRAGSKHIVELHGRIDEVICMQCRTLRDRLDFHHELEHLNHDWLQEVLAERRDGDLRPDGDANLERTNYDEVIVPPCRNCGGFVKPNVVFFGDNVPLDRVELCKAAVDQADGILVVGTSLAVHSAYRHVRAALQKGIPVAILNVGETRVERDGERVLKIEAPAGSTLALCSTHFAKNNGEKLGTTNNVASL